MQTLIEEQQQWESTCNCQCNEFIPRLLSAEKKLGNVSDETRTMITAELRDWANTHHQELEEIKRTLKKNSSVEALKDDVYARLIDLQKDIDQISDANTRAHKDLKSWAKTTISTHASHTPWKDDISNIQAQITSLQRHDYVDTQALRSLEDMVHGLSAQISTMETKITEVESSWEVFEENNNYEIDVDATFQRHFEAFKIDFKNLDAKCDLTIDGLNDMKRQIADFEKEVAILKAQKHTTYYEKPQLKSMLSIVEKEQTEPVVRKSTKVRSTSRGSKQSSITKVQDGQTRYSSSRHRSKETDPKVESHTGIATTKYTMKSKDTIRAEVNIICVA